MIRAMLEWGFEPDILVGSSVGALNAAHLASGQDTDGHELTRIWSDLRRRDILPLNPFNILSGLLGVQPFIASNRALRAFVTSYIPYTNIEHAERQLIIVATDARTGEPVVLNKGPVGTALLASAAMPGIFSPVEHGGRLLIDGSISSDVPIAAAFAAGATDIIVVPTASALPTQSPRHPLNMVQQALSFAIEQHNRTTLLTGIDGVNVHTAPTPQTAVNILDFGHADELIDLGYQTARTWVPTLPDSIRADRTVVRLFDRVPKRVRTDRDNRASPIH
jgi:NTE family protein